MTFCENVMLAFESVGFCFCENHTILNHHSFNLSKSSESNPVCIDSNTRVVRAGVQYHLAGLSPSVTDPDPGKIGLGS